MNENEWIRSAVRGKLINRDVIRERAIDMAETRLGKPDAPMTAVSRDDRRRTLKVAAGTREDGTSVDRAVKPRTLVLAADLLLLALAIGLVVVITGKDHRPAAETSLPTTLAVTTVTARETTAPTTVATTVPRTTGTLAGEPETLTIAKGGIGAFQLSLWKRVGDPASGYPAYYAGAYFEHPMSYMSTLYDDGFTILVTCDPALVEHDLWQAVNQTEDIPYNLMPMTIVQVEHSYNELLIQYNVVLELTYNPPDTLPSSDRELLQKISRVGIDEKENEVFVEVPAGTIGLAAALDRALAGIEDLDGVDAKIRVYEMAELPSTEEVREIEKTFLSRQGLRIVPNSGYGERIVRLPDGFDAFEDGFPIGEYLRQRNERSTQNGLDFSRFMGKDVYLDGYAVTPASGDDTGWREIWLVIGDGEVAGYWYPDELTEPGSEGDYLVLSRYLEGGDDHYSR